MLQQYPCAERLSQQLQQRRLHRLLLLGLQQPGAGATIQQPGPGATVQQPGATVQQPGDVVQQEQQPAASRKAALATPATARPCPGAGGRGEVEREKEQESWKERKEKVKKKLKKKDFFWIFVRLFFGQNFLLISLGE